MSTSLATVDRQGYSIFYRENSVDVEVLDASFEKDIFYPAIPEFAGSPSAIVIDVGAHIGTFSIHSLLAGKAGKIISLEPNKETFGILHKNVEANGFSQSIIPLEMALSNKNGVEKLYLDEENWGHSLTNEGLNRFEEVPCLTLETLLLQQKINSIDLIKFNCEGAEFQIILSLEPGTLSKIKMMLILFHEDLVKGFSRHDLLEFLDRNGFLIRTDYESSNRGWIIAKSREHYSASEHRIILAQKNVRSGVKHAGAGLRRFLARTNIWKYVKGILKKD